MAYLAVTDPEWFEFHRKRWSPSVVFWKPTTKVYRHLSGSLLYFLVKSYPRNIAGNGSIVEVSVDSVANIWKRFDAEVGHRSVEDWLQEMNTKRGSNGQLTAISRIGYYRLSPVSYFDPPLPPTATEMSSTSKRFQIDIYGPIRFNQANVRGQYLNEDEIEWINQQMAGTAIPAEGLQRNRADVEQKAIQIATEHFSGNGFKVSSVEKDNVGWDLVATKNESRLLIEVKGLSGNLVSCELTPNEYLQMRTNRDKYQVCIVTKTLSSLPELRCFFYSKEANSWISESGNSLEIQEVVSARLSSSDAVKMSV